MVTPVFAAIAAVLTLVVLGAVAWPLRGSRTLATGIVLALGLSTFVLYRMVGTPAAIDVPAPAAAPRSMAEAVAALEAELARNPDQPQGWQLLARSYAMLERPADARDAYARAAKLLPDDPDVLVEAAQARLFASPDRRLDATAVAMLRHALAVQPRHQRARWFLGVWQRQNGDDAGAARTWEPLLAQVDAKTEASLRAQIDAARAAAGQPPLPAAHAAAAATDTKTHAIEVKVSLDPGFASRVRLRGDASVFVIARVPNGPPMPVAVEKHALQELPLAIVLDDGDGPMPTQKLSALREVEVLARLSASGDPMRRAGDPESKPVRVRLPANGPVELVIGDAQP